MTDTFHPFRASSISALCAEIVGWYRARGCDVKVVSVDGRPFDGMNWALNRSLTFQLELRCGDESARVTTFPLTGGYADYQSAYGGANMYSRAIERAGGKLGCDIYQSAWK